MSHNDEVVELMRENAKLREALQDFVDTYTADKSLYMVLVKARAVLSPSPDGVEPHKS